MKTISRLVVASFLMITSFVSNAQGINFQGVSRSANGTILANSNISLRLSIMSKSVDATPEYVEIKKVVTNTQGIFSIVIGDALTSATGSFKNINWAAVPKFLKVEMDPSGGTSFINMGITQLQYVPFSFYSLGVAAENVIGVLPVEKGGTGVGSLADLKAALKLSNFDSTALSNRIDTKLTKGDTASLSNRINAVSGVVSQDAKYNLKVGKDITANSNTGYWNIAIGGSSLTRISTGDRNIGIGAYALSSNSAGAYNIGIGSESMFYNTIGSGNNAIGLKAMQKNTTGNNNNAFGFYALAGNTSGGNNVAIGDYTLYNNTTAFNNVAVGSNAMYANTTGANNVAIGKSALATNKIGTDNISIGYNALSTNDEGSHNVAIGSYALQKNKVATAGSLGGQGFQNVAVGSWALQNAISNSNVAIGAQVLQNLTTGGQNTGLGEHAMRALVTGGSNVSIGYMSMIDVGPAVSNAIMIGRSAGQSLKSGSNVGVGNYALAGTTTGEGNVAVGNASLERNTSGSRNAVLGQEVMNYNTTGENNTSMGSSSMIANTTGSNNTGVGFRTLTTNSVGSNNTALGSNANVSLNDLSNATAIGSGAIVTSSNTIQLGNTSVTDVKTSGVITAAGFKLPNGTSAQYLRADGSVSTSVTSGVPYTGAIQAVDLGAFDLKVNGLTVGIGAGTPSVTTNTALGNQALRYNTTGENNLAIGFAALLNNKTSSNNIGIGNYSLYSHSNSNALLNNDTLGDNNIAIGFQTLKNDTSGRSNIAIGSQSLLNNTSGFQNISIGVTAMLNNTTGTKNNSFGTISLSSNTTGSNNSAFGNGTMSGNTTGSNNSAFGRLALVQNVTGSNNTAVGHMADVASNNLTNATAIGSGAIATASNTVQLGNTSVTEVKTSGIVTSGKGFLPLGITLQERNAIVSPTRGLIIYCSNCGAEGELEMFNGTTWKSFVLGAASDGISSTIQSGMVAYYPFSGNANNAVSNSNNGVVNGATLTADRNGNPNSAYSFNGVDNYINFGNLNYISTGIGNVYSISFWILVNTFNNSSTGDQAMLFGDEYSQNNGVIFQMHKDYGFGAYTAGASSGVGYNNQLPNLNTWVNYVVVQKNDGIYLYVGGNYWGKLTSSTNSETNTDTRIGLFHQSTGAARRPFNGSIDEVRIYNRVLTQDEITYIATH